MIEFTVNKKEEGKTLDKIFTARYPAVPYGIFRRALRRRDVKVNGVRVVDGRTMLSAGDNVCAYIDAAPAGTAGRDANAAGRAAGTSERADIAGAGQLPHIRTVYENDYILLAEKPQGLLSEPDPSRPGEPSLIELVRSGAAMGREGMDKFELCHRLDRNTGGLIFISKRPERTDAVKNALNGRFYRKIYSARVVGCPWTILPLNGSWRPFCAFLGKRAGESRVIVSDAEREGFRPIETWLRLAGTEGDITDASVVKTDAVDAKNVTEAADAAQSLAAETDATAVSPEKKAPPVTDIEAMLITGRTHQIRAHLAHLGFPVAGDGKYGKESQNRLIGLKYQALWASRYEYDPSKEALDPDNILPRLSFTSKPDFR